MEKNLVFSLERKWKGFFVFCFFSVRINSDTLKKNRKYWSELRKQGIQRVMNCLKKISLDHSKTTTTDKPDSIWLDKIIQLSEKIRDIIFLQYKSFPKWPDRKLNLQGQLLWRDIEDSYLDKELSWRMKTNDNKRRKTSEWIEVTTVMYQRPTLVPSVES